MDSLAFAQLDWAPVLESQKLLVDSLQASNKALLQSQAKFSEQLAAQSFHLNNLWMMIATALVFIMHLGFATLESGLTRAKNTVNVLFKNTFIPLVGLVTYFICGFGLMFPGFSETSGGFLGFAGFGLELPDSGDTYHYNMGYTYWTDFLFQGMFAATCATIVSGSVAERVKLSAFMIFSFIFVALVYPVIGSWTWGKGWLHSLGFHDFAGSTLVHSVGGWGALAFVLLLGPRLGKYEHGKIMPIPGHSMTSAVVGVFMLWLGWFGFNGGSVFTADAGSVSLVLVNTCISACVSGLVATSAIWFVARTFDLTMTLNGILAGLVAITAGADVMNVWESSAIGAVGGVLVVAGVLLFDKLKIDDPVGALSVHLLCGIWGTLAVGIFGSLASASQLVHQAIGISASGAAAFITSFALCSLLKYTIGIRVGKDEELYGLDFIEHGMEAYPDFVIK